jgi:iron complex outermembrane recepter protein
MMTSRKRNFLWQMIALWMLGSGYQVVVAQQDSSTELQEITVTAQRREQSLQNVPIAVAVVTGGTIADMKLENVQEISYLVPALQYTSVAAYATPSIRGIGTLVFIPNSDPSVATYVDGAYLSSAFGSMVNMLALDRVEVSEGPQGTLFGRNAMAGAINLITMTPTAEPLLELSTGVGNLADRDGHVYASGKVLDNLFAGIYFEGSERDDYLRVTTPPTGVTGRNLSYDSQWNARTKWVYLPTDSVKFTLSVEHDIIKSSTDTASRQIQANGLGYVFVPQPFLGSYEIATDFGAADFNRQDSQVLREEIDLGWTHILGISAHRDDTDHLFFDNDGTIAPVLALAANPQITRNWSQEVQLQSPAGSKVTWVGGLYFFLDKSGFDPTVVYAPIIYPAVGLPPLSGSFGWVRTISGAAFGQGTYPITDQWGVTLGVRYTRERKSAYDLETNYWNSYGIGGTGLPPALTFPYPNASKTWSAATPKVETDYRVDGHLLYASYSQGFKSGVFNLTTPSALGPANPEYLSAYEFGDKWEAANKRLRINSDAFWYDLKDQQDYVQVGTQSAIENAARARALGFEVNIDAIVTERLALNASAIGEHGWYRSFPAYSGVEPAPVGNTAVNIDVTGNQLARMPKWSGVVGGEFKQPIPSGTLSLRASFLWNGGEYFDPSNAAQTWQAAYGVLNSSLSYRTIGDHLTFTGWVKNALDRLYEIDRLYNTFGTNIQDAPPRTFGLTVTYHY